MARPFRDADYRALADFRHHLRRFTAFSEDQARTVGGIEPRQHQLLLALRGLPADARPTIGTLAERLVLRHHTVVELVDRSEGLGLVRRETAPEDGRLVLVTITARGRDILAKLSFAHHAELERVGPALVTALLDVLRPT